VSSRVPKERPNATRLLKHPWLADTRPRTLATPLTNISMESGPLGFRAPNLLIPSSASPVRVSTELLVRTSNKSWIFPRAPLNRNANLLAFAPLATQL
jgi:hypothetical protein